MVEIIILGTTKHSHMLKKIIETEKVGKIVAFTADEKYITKADIKEYNKSDFPLIPLERIEDYYPPSKYKILNTIGYTKMNSVRKKKNEECLRKGYKLYTYISKNAIILSKINVDSGNIIMPGAYIGTNVIMGESNVIYSGSILTHDITLGSNIFIAAGSTIGGNVTIGNNSFLGLNCTIKNTVKIAKYSLIGAGTYINKNTEPYSIYVPEKTKRLNKSSLNVF